MRTTDDTQIVFLDTPGIHKPSTLLGERTNSRALTTLGEVDVICFLIDASEPIGRGDRFIAELVAQVRTPTVLVVNKIDRAEPEKILEHLPVASGELGEPDAFVPLSARTGEGADALVAELEARMPEGPHYYPDGVVSDQPESVLAAELLREKLLARDARRAAALDRGDRRGGRGARRPRTGPCSRSAWSYASSATPSRAS